MEPLGPAPPAQIALNPNFRDSQEALLQALLQATDYGILMSGLDRQDIVANRRMGELFAVPPQHVVESNPAQVREVVNARVADPDAFEEQSRRTYADPALSYEDEIEVRSDPPRILRRFTGPVNGRDGEPIGRLWTFLDITETKLLQAEVQAQLEARTQDYLVTAEVTRALNAICRLATENLSLPDLLTAIAERVRPLLRHECAAVLLRGKTPHEVEGVGCPVEGAARPMRFVVRRDRALALALEGGALDPNLPMTLYPDYHGPLARRLRCATIGVAPLRNEGEVIGALVLGTRAPSPAIESYRAAHLRSLIDQVALTLQTHRLQTDLQAAMTSLQTTQRRLVEMEKLRTAGTLAASVAHDIRNILTTLQMEIALQPDPIAQTIRAQLDRFSTLTHRLLAYARPTILETRPTSVADVLRRILPLVEGQAHIANVAIRLEFPDDAPPVAADASQLEHLFVNLCLNAIQAMTEQTARPRDRTTPNTLTLAIDPGPDWLGVRVQDTGGGIAPDILTHIFDPFFTTRGTGMGLGLFSCKRTVEDHGGQIAAANLPQGGAVFTVLLPTLPARRNA